MARSTQPRFSEMPGGIIIDQFGREVLRLNLDGFKLAEAKTVMDAILPALEAAFARSADVQA